LAPVFESSFDSSLEGQFACYLDSQAALRWWHRNVARTQYGLQGWRRDKVYPDFVFARADRDGRETVVVMETKGLHLKGADDTDYKRELLARLSELYSDDRLQRAGELALVDATGVRLVCDLVFDEAWRGVLAARHFGADAATHAQ
jgi:type III restriction enzyme